MISTGFGTWAVFSCLATLAIGGGLLTITRNNLVGAVMSLVVSFVGVAGLYAMLSAHFLAVIQILVYAGGIMVLFIFVVMVLNRDEQEPWLQKGLWSKTWIVGAGVYLLLRLGQLLYRFATTYATQAPTHSIVSVETGSVQQTGVFLFSNYLFVLEAISIMLLIAIVAAVVIARGHAAQPTSSYETENHTGSPAVSHEEESVHTENQEAH